MAPALFQETIRTEAAKIFTKAFGGILQISPSDAHPIWVDGRPSPPLITAAVPDGKEDPDCVWRGASDVLLRVLSGERALESAFVSGRFTIAGDMSIMARLDLATKI